MKITNVLLVGVGGQGTVLASKVFTKGLIEAGFDVKMSEIHGMAQRGGSVSTQVRFGEKIESAVIGAGQADILVSFEAMEALRYLYMLKPGGTVITNNLELPSAPITAGLTRYPDGVLDEVKVHANTYVIEATKYANELGNERVMNIILFGALAKLLQIENVNWEDVISTIVKPKVVDINLEAYRIGQGLVGEVYDN